MSEGKAGESNLQAVDRKTTLGLHSRVSKLNQAI
jgi:hypothetical protein